MIDVGAKKDCYAMMWSYGEICVGCGCCSEDPVTRITARISYHQEMLHNDRHFDGWYEDDPEILALQKRNVEADIKWNEEKLKELRKELRKLRKENENVNIHDSD